MPREVKPKQHQRSAGTFSIEPPISDNDFVKIAKTLKIKDLTDEARKELLDIAQEYRIGVELAKNKQTSPEIRYTLNMVYKKATSLSECLKIIDSASKEKIEMRLSGAFVPQMRSFACPFCERMFLDEAGFQSHLSEHQTFSSRVNTGPSDTLERCQADAERIALAARAALQSVSSKPGPKSPRAPYAEFPSPNGLGDYIKKNPIHNAKHIE